MVLGVSSDWLNGAQSERIAQQMHRRRDQQDTVEAIASWKAYAAQLEQRLQQAQAESYAAQYQRNVLASQLDQVQAEIRRVDPRNPLGDEVALTRAARAQVDQHLATKGLQIDRSNPKVFAVKGKLR